MAIRFIRQPSDTPSITNIDDARSIRYAYGGQDGFVQKAGNELSYTIVGNLFRINSGVVVLQGWESEIDSNGWTMTVDNVATKRYYSVYYEVNLAAQTTEIKSVYDTTDYPEISVGDDLTEFQTGTARLLLYRFTAQNGIISDVSKEVKEILFITLVSNRPPIMSISVPETVGVPYGRYSPSTHAGHLQLSQSYQSAVIGYFPNGSNNSIKSVEITYENIPDVLPTFFEYTMDSQGQFIFSTQSSFLSSDNAKIVKAKITDIYENVHNVSWTVRILE